MCSAHVRREQALLCVHAWVKPGRKSRLLIAASPQDPAVPFRVPDSLWAFAKGPQSQNMQTTVMSDKPQ